MNIKGVLGIIANMCTFDVLKEVCKYRQCKKK